MTTSTITILIAALGLGLLIVLIWLIYVSLGISKINRREQAIIQAGQSGDFVKSVEQSLQQLKGLHQKADELDARLVKLSEVLQCAVQRVGVIRFDAFEDIGGKQSFSIALLDDHGNGMVMSAINGRQESRTYAKPVVNSTSEFNLSTEEEQAIEQALETDKPRVSQIKAAN